MAHDPTAVPGLSCPSCDIGPFTRNAYWTGKLMLAADFIAEQDYLIDKLRHHNQRLHGWGVVCGLKVVQHDNADCRKRYVCVEAGSAIDCCGYDIVVREKDCIDLFTVPAIRALREAGDTTPHTLQICIRYRECGTEAIPVLYDECGCDDGKCAPNRILESYELDVLVLPSPLPPEPPPTHPAECSELWTAALDACPACEQPNCVVLATVTDYVIDLALVDPPTPDMPAADGRQIDNLLGRRILPSTSTIHHVLECVDAGGGGPGTPGSGIDTVEVEFLPCEDGVPQTGGSLFDAATRTLHLRIPEACPVPPPRLALPRIANFNWQHGVSADRDLLKTEGLVVAFDRPVLAATLNEQTVQVLLRQDMPGDIAGGPTMACYCNVRGIVTGIAVEADCLRLEVGTDIRDPAVRGVRFRPARVDDGMAPAYWPQGEYRVVLEGDHILGADKIEIPNPDGGGVLTVYPALDANHLGPGVRLATGIPPGPPDLPADYAPRCPSGNGTEGGRFISWFTLQ